MCVHKAIQQRTNKDEKQKLVVVLLDHVIRVDGWRTWKCGDRDRSSLSCPLIKPNRKTEKRPAVAVSPFRFLFLLDGRGNAEVHMGGAATDLL